MYRVGQEEVDAVSKVILSKKYFRYAGKNHISLVDKVEEKFQNLFDIKKTLLVTSGTNALVAAFAAAGIALVMKLSFLLSLLYQLRQQ